MKENNKVIYLRLFISIGSIGRGIMLCIYSYRCLGMGLSFYIVFFLYLSFCLEIK